MKIDLSLRLCNDQGQKIFGKGVAQLLHFIDSEGSMNLAVRKMGIAYSKAWKILHNAEDQLGYELVSKQSGGRNGGGSALTAEGRIFLERYENFDREARAAVEAVFAKYW